jgi:hypothetical protein
MTASPPVGGWSSWHRYQRAAPAAFAVAAVAGALAAGAALWLVAFPARPPLGAVGVVALAGVALHLSFVERLLPSPRWRIPRHWCRHGVLRTSGLFGSLLGAGFFTATTSPAAYAIWAWALYAPGWSLVWPVFLAFALGRAMPMRGVEHELRSCDIVVAVDAVAGRVTRLRLAELATLGLLAGAILFR